MFDIYGVIDFHRRRDLSKIKNPFEQYTYYAHIPFQEHVVKGNHFRIIYLERPKTSGNYCCDDSKHFFLFGYVFSNKNYELLEGKKPKKLLAVEVYSLYKRFEKEVVNYIKGSFVLIIYDERDNDLICISDKLNVLPIYYAFKNGVFIFSSAIKPILDSGFVSARIDKTAIIEFAIFDYPLGSKTYYEDIAMLDYGTLLQANNKGIRTARYFAVDHLFQEKLMKKKESLQALGELLHENINLYASHKEKFLVSLTGGFDGRMNLALIDRSPDDFLCYSYGMPGSRQISVPMEISQRLNISYKPIYLDKEFEEQYEDCALKAVFFSDGTAPILRADYPYAYKRLMEFSDIAITGLFGSEILRPLRNLGTQVNDNSGRLFMGDDFDTDLKNICEYEKKRLYLKPELFKECFEELRTCVWENYFATYRNKDKLTRFYIFFIGEGVRKYFMQEIRIERVFVTTYFPYFDSDLVSLIFKTQFAGMYNGALKQSPFGRRNAQSLYAYLISRYKPALGDIITDRGYKPKDLLSAFSYIKILPGYLKTKKYYKKVKNDTFNAERWTDFIFSKSAELMKKETPIFPGTLIEKYENGQNITENYYFSRIFSLKYWFEKC